MENRKYCYRFWNHRCGKEAWGNDSKTGNRYTPLLGEESLILEI